MSNTPIIPTHTYVVLQTIAEDGTRLVDRPCWTRIVGVHPPRSAGYPGAPVQYAYAQAQAQALTINAADGHGHALTVDAADLHLYEPGFDWWDHAEASQAAQDRLTARNVILAAIAAEEAA